MATESANIVRVAFVYLEREGEVFLVQEKGGHNRGLWSPPGGHVDEGETPGEAAVREAKEESGYTVVALEHLRTIRMDNDRFRSSAKNDGKIIEVHIFSGTITGDQESIAALEDDDILDARWFRIDAVQNLPLRGDWVTLGL